MIKDQLFNHLPPGASIPTSASLLNFHLEPPILSVLAFSKVLVKTGFLYSFFFFFSGLHLQHVEVPRLGAESDLHLSNSNAGSEPCLQPTPQLTAVLDP